MAKSSSKVLFRKALNLMPGGVNSPVRAFRSVGGQPLFIARARGSKIWDVEGRKYIDYVSSWGPMIVGHAHPEVVAAVQKSAALGTSYGAPTAAENVLAQLVMGLMVTVSGPGTQDFTGQAPLAYVAESVGHVLAGAALLGASVFLMLATREKDNA